MDGKIGRSIKDDRFIPALHGLRGVAALSVVAAHTWWWTGLPFRVSPALGVVLFFVLSGFLMGHLYLRQPFSPTNVFRYAVARFARVYPLFAVVVITSVLIQALFGASPFKIGFNRLWQHLLLAGPGGTIWTVSTEFQFYGAFALIWLGYSVTPARARDLLIVGLGLAIIVISLTLPEPESRIALPRYIHLFMLGLLVSIALHHLRSAWVAKLMGWMAIVLALGYLGLFLVPALGDNYHSVLVGVTVCGLVLAVVLSPQGRVSGVLGSRPFVFLGEISFGIYLLHRFVELVLRLPDRLGVPGPILFAAEFGGTIALAYLAHITIEKPARRWIRLSADRLVNWREPLKAKPAAD